jgi:tetratricopeptide (TPR) repeat protein
LALAPDSAIARNNLGLALAAEPQEALRYWEKGSDKATAHNNLAAVMIEQGRLEEARRELDLALGYNRNHPAALANLRLIAQLDGRPTAVPAQQGQRSGWRRFLSAFWRELAGLEEAPRAAGPRAAR